MAALLALAITGPGATAQSEVAVSWPTSRLRFSDSRPRTDLVIQVDDPDVKVRIDGEDVILTGGGPRELRLSVGTHRVEMAKGGKVEQDIITITAAASRRSRPRSKLIRDVPNRGTRQREREQAGQRSGIPGVPHREPMHEVSPRESARAIPGAVEARSLSRGVTANIALRVHDYDV